MKHFNFWALALTAIIVASCTSEDDLTLSPPANQANEETEPPIMFSSSQSAFTRADFTGAEAAAKLGNKFVVTGFKSGDVTTTPTTDGSTAGAGTIVFDNYKVEYAENTANTTESNSSNWEYVGKERIQHAIDNGITQQTIKYWDYTKTQYDFIAWSTGTKTAIYKGNPNTGEVLVSNIQPNSKNPTWTVAGTGDNPDPARIAYTLTGKAADLKECFVSDLVTVKKGDAGTYGEVSGYNQTVKLKFRQLGTKVRIGIYETVPGYSVKNVAFYSAAASNDAVTTAAKIFTTEANSIYTEGTYKIYFPTVDTPTDADNNQAHIKFAPKDGVTQETKVEWGAMNYTIRESGEKSEEAVYLGRSSNTASYAGTPDDNYYVIYLPNQNGTNLNLRVNYTLESIDGSGEIIEVKGATAQVPSIYTSWKPGFAYTYLFKISDKTNGHTGVYDPTQPDNTTVNSDPAGLYPITFDALVVNAEEDKSQETITTISTPSITTYQNGSNVVNKNEYTVLTSSDPKITGEIYVTVNDGDAEKTPDLANGKLVDLTGKAALYTIPAGKTEAEVVAALQMRDDDAADGTIKGRSGLVLTEATAPNALSLTNEVCYGADGNKIVIPVDGSKQKAAKFTPSAGTTYVFVYTKTAASGDGTVFYEARPFANFTTDETKYRYAYVATTKSHTDNKGTEETTDDVDYFDAQKDVKYFTESAGAYSRVVAPFIGQGVSNLYLDAAGNTIATGYAVSGTKYYYTVDGGQNYIEAHNVEHKTSGWLSGLYEKSGDSYTATSDIEPANNKAYYYLDGSDYIYCVFLPQQVKDTDTYVLDEDKAHCVVASETTAVDGQTYFDKYTQNNGVYYVKVIKVQ